MYKARQISPIIPSFHLNGTVLFFRDILEFKVVRDDRDYVILHKDGNTVHICRAGKDVGEMSCYLEVDNVDTVWESIKNKIEGIKVREPFDRDYGMRELHIIVPDTQTLMFIGHEIKG